MKAGAYYWNGWSDEKTHALTESLKSEFFDREPLWGWINNINELMEKEIACASENGIDFFAFDWYYPEIENKYTFMNDAVDAFLKAKNSNCMEFCYLIANHEGYRVLQKDWQAIVDLWMPYLKQNNYLKADGKPLLIFFSPTLLTKCMGGSENVKNAFKELQARAVMEGLEGISIAGCCSVLDAPESVEKLRQFEYEGYTHFTGYNYNEHRFKGDLPKMKSYFEFLKTLDKENEIIKKYLPKRIRPYSELIEDSTEIWDNFAKFTSVKYIPCVTCGWDCRPWEQSDKIENHTWYYPDRTARQVAEFIDKAAIWLENNKEKSTNEKIILLYAWNEFGEGGYIAPTKGDNGQYLKAIYKVLKNKY